MLHAEKGVCHTLPPGAVHWSQEWSGPGDRYILIFYGKEQLAESLRKRRRKQEVHKVYFQSGPELYEATLESKDEVEKFHDGVAQRELLDRAQATFFLNLKASGKELDPKHFNDEEKEMLTSIGAPRK